MVSPRDSKRYLGFRKDHLESVIDILEALKETLGPFWIQSLLYDPLKIFIGINSYEIIVTFLS